jgi:hypothetical protein
MVLCAVITIGLATKYEVVNTEPAVILPRTTHISRIKLLSTPLAAPSIGTAPTQEVGTTIGSTKLILSLDSGTSFKVNVVSRPTAIPAIGSTPLGTAYISGNDITGVDITTNKYVDVYELDASGKVVNFTELTVTAANSTAPLFKSAPVVAPGSQALSTKVTLTANTKGDTFAYIVGSAPGAIPQEGSTVPTSAIGYTSGADITGVDTKTNRYLDLYEVSGGNVVAFKEIILAGSDIAAPSIGTTPTQEVGTTIGSTKLILSLDYGTSFKVNVVSKPTSIPAIGSTPLGTAYISGNDITGVDVTTNKYVDVYELNASGNVVNFTEVTVTNSTAPLFKSAPVVAPGSQALSTKATLTANTKGDTFAYIVGSAPGAIPQEGSPLPTKATVYTSGADITGVDTKTNRYLDLYEVSGGNVVAFKEIILTGSDIAAPLIGTTPTQEVGTTIGSTKLILSLDYGTSFKVNVVSKPTSIPAIGSTPLGTAYISGNDITGVDVTTNKYVDVYELNASGNVVNFTEVTVTAANSTAPLFKSAPVVAPGSAAMSTKVTLTANTKGDTFAYIVGSAPGAIPQEGSTVPTSAIGYTSGADITGVDTKTNRYLDLYEVSGGNVVAFKEIILTGADIAAPPIGNAPTQVVGTTIGSTKLNLSLDYGTSFKVNVVSKPTAIPAIGSTPLGTAYISGNDITGVDVTTNKYVDVYELNASGKVVNFTEVTVTNSTAPLFKSAPVVAPGSQALSTKATLTANTKGDTFAYIVGSAPGAIPQEESPLPTKATVYTSGADITGVDTKTNRYLDLYEVSGGNVVAFKEIILTGSDIAAPLIGTTPTQEVGTTIGSTKLILSLDYGTSFKVNVVSKPTSIPAIGSTPLGTAYISGNDITGVDVTTNKYVDVYELDASGNVVNFTEVTVTNSTAPLFKSSPVVAPGSQALSTKTTLTANTKGDTFAYIVGSAPGAIPQEGSTVPTAAIGYTSGADITGVDTKTNRYLDLYEVSGGNVVAFKEIILAGADIAAPPIGTTPTQEVGTTIGSTKLNLSLDSGTSFKVNVVSKPTAIPAIGSTPLGTAYISGNDITGVDITTNKYVDVYELDASGKVVNFTESTVTAANSTAPLFKSAPVVASGSEALSTKVTLTANTKGDTFAYIVGSAPGAIPQEESQLPTAAIGYTSGADITGVDTKTNRYLDLYEVSGGNVVAFKEIILTGADIAAPPIGNAPTQVVGTTIGSTKLNLSLDYGTSFKVNVVSKPTAIPAIGSTPLGTAYISGNDITGVDVTTNKYVDVYELNASGKVVNFTEVTVTNSTAPLFKSAPVVAPGSQALSTKVTLTANTNTDTFAYIVGSAPGAIPQEESQLPTAAIGYTSGADITGVDTTTNRYLDLYEVSGGNVVAFKEIILAGADIAAPPIGTTPTQEVGTTIGSTKLNLSLDSGTSFKVNVVSKPTAIPAIGSTPLGTAYISGNDITGVDITTNKYVDVYELDASGKVVNFTELTVTAANSTAPLFKSAPVVAPGSQALSTKVTLTANTKGDTFAYIVGSAPGAIPQEGSTVPTSAIGYTSGADITGVDTTTNRYLDLYEVSGGSVVAFKEIILAGSDIAAPPIGTAPTQEVGTTIGSTKLNLSLDSGTSFKVNVVSKPTAIPAIGSTPLGTAYISGNDITGVDITTNKYVDVYELDASGKVVNFTELTVTAANSTAPLFKSAPVVAPGSQALSTKVTLTANTKGDTFAYIVGSAPGAIPQEGSTVPTSAIGYTSGADITGVDTTTNRYLDLYEVSGGSVVAFKEIILAGADIAAPPIGTTY